MKDYLLKFLTTSAPENAAGQDALEWALRNNLLSLTYELEADVRQALLQYDVIFESYHQWLEAQVQHSQSLDHFLTRIAA